MWMPDKLTRSRSWEALLHGFSCLVANGQKHGPTCRTLYVYCTYHCTGTLIRADIGNSIARDTSRLKAL
eukprot:4219489-Pyramimonas_sp.AAC.1